MSNLATITNNILADSGIDDINVIVSTGSYANPAWITSLAWTKITGAPSNIVTGTGTTNTIPRFTGASTIGDSSITDNTNEVSISKRLFLNTGGQSILFTPNLGGSSNRIETSALPLEITTTGSAVRLAAGGVTAQLTLASSGVVTLTNLAGTGTRIVTADASGNLSASSALSGYIQGSGTTNTLPKFTGSTTIGNSLFTDNGTNGAIGGTNYSGGTGVRSFNISAPLYAGLAFWVNDVYASDIFSYVSTGNLIISADPTNVLASSRLILSVDGTNRVVVLANGNVGIGDITASAKLEIQTASGAEALALSGYQLLKWDLGDQLWFGGYNAGQWSTLKFATSGSERFRVTSSGNLDFNINGSQSYIHLNQGTSTDGGLIFRRNNANTWQLAQSTSGNNLLFYSYGVADNVLTLNNSTRAATFTGSLTVNGIYNVPASSYFISGVNGFRFNNSTDAFNNFIVFDNGNTYTRGNVLIGTTTDVGSKLYVDGGIRASGALLSGGLLEFTGGWSASPYNSSAWVRPPAGVGVFLVNNAITRWAGFKPNNDFEINGGNFYVHSSSGNVGINSASDNGSRLQVSGNARITGSTNEQLVLDYTTASGGFTWQSFRLNGTNRYRIFGNTDNSFTLWSDILSSNVLSIASTGAATFSSSLTAGGNIQGRKGTFGTTGIGTPTLLVSDNDQSNVRLRLQNTSSGNAWDLIGGLNAANNSDFSIYDVANNNTVLRIVPNSGNATFSSSVTSLVNNISADGAGVVLQGYVDNNLRIAVRGSGYNSGARGGLLASTGDFSSSVTATNLSINTTTTDGRIDVRPNSVSSFPIFWRNNNGGYGGGVYVTGGNNMQLYLANSSGTENVLISSLGTSHFNGGNVLIGTTTDGGYRLDVAGTIRSFSASPLVVSMTSNPSVSAIVGARWTSGVGMNMSYFPDFAQGFIDNTYPVTAGEVYGDIYFRQNVSGTMTTRMTIQARTGNVSIGTDTANQRLTVNGFVRASGLSINEIGGTISGFIGYEKNWIGSGTSARLAIAAESDAINFYTSGSSVLRARFDSESLRFNPNNTAFNMYLWLNRNVNQDGGILMSTDNSLDWQISNANRDLWFYSYGLGTTAFRVMRNTGNFLIGTTTDTGDRLYVNGNTFINGNIATVAPSGANSASWRLGDAISTTPPAANRLVRISINGTLYSLLAFSA